MPIVPFDTGIMMRNARLARQAAAVLFCWFDRGGVFVDYAGGYGIFTRLMRDIGFDFRWYDLYAPNLLAQGFEFEPAGQKIDLVTSFESFEHFPEPLAEVEKMLQISRNLLFSTELLPEPVPEPDGWWYYMFEFGQHISFYSLRSLHEIAKKFGLNLYSYKNVHLFTEKLINPSFFRYAVKYSHKGLSQYVERRMQSRTYSDIEFIRSGLAR